MLNNLSSTTQKAAKRVGRGGKRGKTSGRGHKGQKARAGGTPRPEMRDIIKKLPKRRGHGKNRARTVVYKLPTFGVNVATLEALFSNGDAVNVEALVEKGLVSRREAKKRGIKILGHGELSKKLTVSGVEVSAAAQEKITRAGGSVA